MVLLSITRRPATPLRVPSPLPLPTSPSMTHPTPRSRPRALTAALTRPLSLWKRSRLLRPLVLVCAICLLVYKLGSADSASAPNAYSYYAHNPLSMTKYIPEALKRARPRLPAEPETPRLVREEPLVRVRPPEAPHAPVPLGATRPRNLKRPDDPPEPVVLEAHHFLPNGLMAVNPKGRHPIYDLIERGEREWQKKLDDQSKTLREAVIEYRRRYGRPPPRGFDKWWAYVQRHNVQLPDEYDQILADLGMFYAYTPRALRRLQAATRANAGTYTLSSSSATLKISLTAANLHPGGEEEIGLIRAKEQLAMLRGYNETWGEEGEWSVEREIVEATGDWEATFGGHDVPQEFADWDLYNERRVRARSGQFMDVFKRPEMVYKGWGGACPHSSPLRQSPPKPPPLPIPQPDPKTFIFDHRASMNACVHTQLVHLVGFLSGHHMQGPGPQEVHRLLFGMCKTEGLHGDILTVASEQWTEDVGVDPPWKEKTDDRLVWRGSTTGILHSPETPWRLQQRVRLISMLNAHHGNQSVLVPAPADQPIGEPQPRRAAWLNHVLTDAAFTREPIQCREGVCALMEEMFEWRGLVSQSAQNRYKYVMDIDGNGWSARFKRLISTNSLVLKATIFPEWYQDRIMPWVHYVPIKMDLTDLYDVLLFFRGDVERGGEGGHDEMAERIASAGAAWSRAMFRRVDMVAYMWRLFLEYGRLVNDDRENMNFEMDLS